ncbi:MAG TPA: serine hydroxymethyltransferase, partial [Aggregatilineales bacterium]|nr:serine hydroxymethyltransferase [Aggregatilineales bacterium]
MAMRDYLFRGDLADLDPDVARLINLEAERQIRRLIMIPSEASVPFAVREALTSPFHNIYAEGYPDESTRTITQAEILDIDLQLSDFRRHSDPRFYKGTEFANLIESLARRRGAELLANDRFSADRLFVNVQALSGAPANSAVYTALIQPGDTIMGMDLLHGGHLTHGSKAARSGKQYHAVFYGVNPHTELLDYDQAYEVAMREKPKIIIAGYSSYPWAPDWSRFRKIADDCGAYLLADIAHVLGLVVAGVYPSPVGIADIITSTTHKTLAGPRGAIIVTHRADLARKLDRGVFPGEQGGPHVNTIAALAVAFKLATTPEFHELQLQTVKNAMRLATRLGELGVRVVHGGTNTHLLTVDLKPIVGTDGTFLSGDIAARILDLVGITCNRNTIPGDTAAIHPSGIRLGTPWITQRGFREPEIDRLADIIAAVLTHARPFSYDAKGGKEEARAKVDFTTMMDARCAVAALCDEAGIDYRLPVVGKELPEAGRSHLATPLQSDKPGVLEIRGKKAQAFLGYALTSEIYGLKVGQSESTFVLDHEGSIAGKGKLDYVAENLYQLHVENAEFALHWLQALSDGFVIYDETDLYGKIPGPVAIRLLADVPPSLEPFNAAAAYSTGKDYFVGINGARYAGPTCESLPEFTWTEPGEAPLKRTPLYALHKETLKARMAPFAGYDMPVWYSSVSEEHAAVRTHAGVFDVSHMGTWEVSGPMAEHFLDIVTTNDVVSLAPGDAHYSYLLGVDGVPLDDIYIYRLEAQKFMMVVNASNNDKDWDWVNAVRDGKVRIDPVRPGARALENSAAVTLRDLRAPSSGADRRVDIALQGPRSLDIMLNMDGPDADKKAVKGLAWSTVTRAVLGGFDLIVSRTGYTGERIGYELFVHPDRAAALFQVLIDLGAAPCGLAARDSTRTEAGLPLYGHELGGALALTPGDAGYPNFVKLFKPFFIGKYGYVAREQQRDAQIVRFRMDSKGVRPPQNGDPVVDRRGRVIGLVTSCSIDTDGYQTGQAYVKLDYSTEGTPLFIFGGAEKNARPFSVAGLA